MEPRVVPDVFQSAPRSEERGDPLRSGGGDWRRGFNPRLAPKSEAMVARAQDVRAGVVSIRASLRRARRWVSPDLW